MSRHRKSGRTIWQIKLTLIAGEDDDLIALRATIERGLGAASVKQIIRAGGLRTAAGPVDDDAAIEASLDALTL